MGSLFSGIGGLELGLERAGWEVRWQVEIDPDALRVLERHWPGVTRYGDITKVDPCDLEWVDMLCGGFPCQDVSTAGKRKGIIEGTRSGLWFEMLRLASALRPRYILVENVEGIYSHVQGLNKVLGSLAEIGYDAEWDMLPASAFGAPHRRNRFILLAYPIPSHTDGLGQDLGPSHGYASPASLRFASARTEDAGGLRDSPRDYRGDWPPERGVRRVGNGVPGKVDGPAWAPPRLSDESDETRCARLRTLGNAVVPQVAEYVGRRILEWEWRHGWSETGPLPG